jgi:hypothetical protein
MKKFVPAFIAFALAFSLVIAGFTPAQAATKWGDPTVTPISGDTEFTITLLYPSKIGSYKGESGLTIPEGYLDGEKQFGGKLLVLKGVSYGTQTLCFPFPTYASGWRGSIASWNSTKWVIFATSFTPGKEGAATLACTTIYGDGTYGLIVNFSDEDAPAASEECLTQGFTTSQMNWNWGAGILNIDLWYLGDKPLGTKVKWSVVDILPIGSIWGTGLSGSDKLHILGFDNRVGIEFSVNFDNTRPPAGFDSFTVIAHIGNLCYLIPIRP